jgi:hypothetical protein
VALGVLTVGVTLGWSIGRARAGGVSISMPMQYAGSMAELGVPVSGIRDVTIVLWNDAVASDPVANRLCITNSPTTSVAQGRFTVSLDNACTAKIQSNPDAWAEVQVGGVSFGRQKIGAVPYALTAGAVQGLVAASAVNPLYNDDGASGRGGGGASIYNDGNTKQKLVITGNTSSGSAKARIGLVDDVSVGNDLAVGGDLTPTGRIHLGVYVNTAHDVASVSCNGTDVALSGGGDCHQDYDQMILQSHPITTSGRPSGWALVCMNHDNSGITSSAANLYVVCAPHVQ